MLALGSALLKSEQRRGPAVFSSTLKQLSIYFTVDQLTAVVWLIESAM